MSLRMCRYKSVRLLVVAGVALVACVAIPACGSPSPPSSVPVQTSGCVTQQQATQIWTQTDDRLNAIELDPKHAGVDTVTTGAALQAVQQYLQNMLTAHSWTEHEVDKLDALNIISAGCNNSALQVRVAMTLVTDDYIKQNGQTDHHDSAVGQTLHFIDTYTRSNGSWKESDFQSLDQPSPSATPQLV